MPDTISKINNVCLVILTAIALTGALIYTRPVLVPFAFAIFIFAVFSPSVFFFQRNLKISRWPSTIITIFLFLLAFSVISFFIFASIDNFIASADVYKDRVFVLSTEFSEYLASWGIDLDPSTLEEKIRGLPIFSWARNITSGIFSFLGTSVLVVIFVMFLIAGEGAREQRNSLISEIQAKVSRYLVIKLATSLVTGILVGFVLSVLGVELAFMFAVLTVILNFIPSIGSIIATVLPLPIVLLQYGFGWEFLVILSITGSIQFVIGNVLEPKIMGEKMDLHPVAVLMFLIFWGLVWGLPGMFLAVPITAILKIILNKIETTKPLAEILAGRLPNWSS